MTANGARTRSETTERDFDRRVEELGFELVELRRRGHAKRPVLELRIDRPTGEEVSVGDCAEVSRALEEWLDADPEYPERYVLEVSSPGVERRLTRKRHFERFVGRRVAVRGSAERFGPSAVIEGELLGISDERDGQLLRLRLTDGAEVRVARSETREVRLVFNWDSGGTR